MTGLWEFSWNVNSYRNRVPKANNCFPTRHNCLVPTHIPSLLRQLLILSFWFPTVKFWMPHQMLVWRTSKTWCEGGQLVRARKGRRGEEALVKESKTQGTPTKAKGHHRPILWEARLDSSSVLGGSYSVEKYFNICAFVMYIYIYILEK